MNDADAENNCIRDVYIKGTCSKTEAAGIAGICNGAWTSSTCTKGPCIGFTSDEGACVENVYTVKHSRMNLQSFQILEMKLFGT